MSENKSKVTNSSVGKELEKAKEQFDSFDANIKEMTMDRMNMAPKEEVEPQTKLSSREIDKSKNIYLKPDKVIGAQDKFNEKFRSSYEYDKEYVQFIAENKELIGETLELWTRPYGGMSAEFWKVPANTPVWGPRYLAEQIRRKFYHRLVMKQNQSAGQDGMGQYYGAMAADTTIARLTAEPVSTRKSVFMGSTNF